MEKKKEIMLPTSTDDAPVRNFLLLILLVPLAPFIMIYSLITGKLQNPFIVGACLTFILCGGGYFLYNKYSDKTLTREEKILSLFEEVNSKEKNELKKESSTLRISLGADNVPYQLSPMLDIEQDFLTVNYYYYLLQTGYLGKNGEGAVYVLQNALYNSNKNVAKAAWDSLTLIGTAEANQIKEIYREDIKKTKIVNHQEQKRKEFEKKYYYKPPTIKENIAEKLKNIFR